MNLKLINITKSGHKKWDCSMKKNSKRKRDEESLRLHGLVEKTPRKTR